MILKEQQVQNAVIAELGKLDYRMVELKGSGEHGVDIRARHNRYARYFLIECKGDPSINVKSKAAGREVRFLMALGQIITRMQPASGYLYGLAFPASYKQLVIRRISPQLLKHLRLHLFFVSSRGATQHMTWREVSKEQPAA